MWSRLFDEMCLGLRLATWVGWVPPVAVDRPERVELPEQEAEGVRQEQAGGEKGKPLPDMDRVVDTHSWRDAIDRYQELWVDLGGEG
jgi:hypothetical protein